jgi:hypothetical protein
MVDGLRRILHRVGLLARAVVKLLLRPLRLAFSAARRLATRLVKPLARTFIVVVAVLAIALSRAASIARDIVGSASSLMAAAMRRGVARVRRVASLVSAAVGRATRRAAHRIRSAAAALQSSISTSLRRAAVLVRRVSASVRLAVQRAKASAVAAVQGARDILAHLVHLGR